jgi:uncharacterized protein (TIGR03435 family)
MTHLLAIVVSLVLLLPPSLLQVASFEVASIKSGRSDRPQGFSTVGGRFTATSVPLKQVMRRAYAPSVGRSLLRDQIEGGPSWVTDAPFDIEAIAESDSRPTVDQLWSMVRALLEDRFQLKIHREQRQMPVYDLVVIKNEKLRLSQDQTPVDPNAPRITTPGSAPPRGGFRMMGRPSATGPLTLTISGNAVRIEEFISILQQYLDRPVIDKSGLGGLYDVELQFEMASGVPLSSTGTPPAPVAAEPGTANIFTAIQDLGLKLDGSRGPVEVIVIDSVEKPSEN